MKKLIIILLLVATVVVVGRYFYQKNKDATKVENEQTTQSQQSKSEDEKAENANTSTQAPESNPNVKYYTMEEVAAHGSDFENYIGCWTVINDKVYDITEFADTFKHPGGEMIYQACGKDGTTLFETRPEGSGTPHSANAREILEKYYIGDLKK